MVKTAYQLANHHGSTYVDIATYFSNPTLGAENDGVGDYATNKGVQRGDPTNNDGLFLCHVKNGLSDRSGCKIRTQTHQESPRCEDPT